MRERGYLGSDIVSGSFGSRETASIQGFVGGCSLLKLELSLDFWGGFGCFGVGNWEEPWLGCIFRDLINLR